MCHEKRNAIRRVLKDAAEHERFFDYSDVERLAWMMSRAYELGKTSMMRKKGVSKKNNPWKPELPTSL